MGEARPLGRLVLSRAGRDKGRPFIVLGYDGDRAVLADGDLRPVERPKKKNLRHVAFTRGQAEGIAQKLASRQTVTNAEVRAAILRLLPGLDEEAPGKPAAAGGAARESGGSAAGARPERRRAEA